MKLINKLLLIAAFAITTVAPNAFAGLIFDSNNQVTGASNVMVDGVAYDFTFTTTQSCNDLYTCTLLNNDFPFQPSLDTTLSPPNWDASGAISAANALLAMFEAATDVNGLNYDVDPTLVNGCDNYWLCEIMIPWRVRGGDGTFDAVRAKNGRLGNNVDANTATGFGVDTLYSGQLILAAITPASTGASVSVPSPGSLSLFLLSLLFIAKRAKRNK